MQDLHQPYWPTLPALWRPGIEFGALGVPAPDPSTIPITALPSQPWLRPRRGLWQEPPRYQHSYVYGIEYVDGTAVPDLATNAADTIFTVNIDGSSAFYATKLSGVFADARFLVQMRRGANGPVHFSRRVPATLCIGSGGLPFPLIPPVWMRPSLNWQFLLSDDGGGKQSIRLAMHGVAVYPDHAPVVGPKTYRGWDYQTYVVKFETPAAGLVASDGQGLTVGANLTAIQSETVDASGDFLCYGMTIEATGGFLLDLLFSGNKLKPFDRPIHAGNLGATLSSAFPRSAQVPYFWPLEFFLPAKTTLACTVTDLSGANNNIRLMFYGMRLLLAE